MRNDVLNSVRAYFDENKPSALVPGKDYLPASAKSVTSDDLVYIVDAALDMWFTTGRFAKTFETEFAAFMEQKFCLLVNSGSSANLVAFSVLTSELLGDRKIKSGDEVITVAAGFPTTVNPIVQYGCVPVFLDVKKETHQIDVTQLEAALSAKTKAVMVAHTLGNAFEAQKVKEFCERHNLWLIEDCCDAVGARVNDKSVGTFGHLATVSFYPAHHLTMGEGGAVLTSDPLLKKIAESFRDWGRDCWCPTGKDNTCGKRFDQQFADMPSGYDHKYIYTHIGFNLKITDMQAALGLSQLKRIREFISHRLRNFDYLKGKLMGLSTKIDFVEVTPGTRPSWFGFPIRIKPESGKDRSEIIRFLEKRKIGTRLVFAGDLTRQPLYKDVTYRVVGDLSATEDILKHVLWVGIHPLFDKEHLDYIAEALSEAFS
jgi:CDP-6-deoxy-D-xylo-4-hexulose-3-dehydrase